MNTGIMEASTSRAVREPMNLRGGGGAVETAGAGIGAKEEETEADVA